MLVGCCAPALLFNTVTVFPANAPILLHIIVIIINIDSDVDIVGIRPGIHLSTVHSRAGCLL